MLMQIFIYKSACVRYNAMYVLIAIVHTGVNTAAVIEIS